MVEEIGFREGLLFLHYCFKERKHGGHGGLKFGSLAGLMKGLVRFRLGLVSHMMEKDAKRSLESGERERGAMKVLNKI